jgi:hypothetical protein
MAGFAHRGGRRAESGPLARHRKVSLLNSNVHPDGFYRCPKILQVKGA